MPEYSLDLVIFPLLPQAENNGESASRLRSETRAAETTIWLWFSQHFLRLSFFRLQCKKLRTYFSVWKKKGDLCGNICFFLLYKLTDLFVTLQSAIRQKLRKREEVKNNLRHWKASGHLFAKQELGHPKGGTCAIPQLFSQNALFRWLLCDTTTNLNGNFKSLSLSISLFTCHT